MDNLEKKILEAFKRDKEVEYLFEELSAIEDEATPLSSLDEGYEWVYEDITEEIEDTEVEEEKPLKSYNLGDIILVNNYESRTGGHQVGSYHRVLVAVVNKSEASKGTIKYKGFLLSSKVNEKSNKKGSRPYPNNIYISNYSTILDRGAPSNKEAFIRVDDLVSFTNHDLSDAGVWKGRASREFIEFVKQCYNNYTSGEDNSEVYWEK